MACLTPRSHDPKDVNLLGARRVKVPEQVLRAILGGRETLRNVYVDKCAFQFAAPEKEVFVVFSPKKIRSEGYL